jgi:hypothetical protein
VGLASATAVLISTLTILAQSNRSTPLVGQERTERPAAASATDTARLTSARAINMAVMNK